jgi:hypothetical protein
MSITLFSCILGFFLITSGMICFKLKPSMEQTFYRWLRNDSLGIVVFLIPATWFMIKLTQLGEADFGQYKSWLLLLFGFTFIGCCIYWRDFLIVRGLAMLSIMSIDALFKISYMNEAIVSPAISLLFYICIIIALYCGCYPYCIRNILPKVFSKNSRYIKYVGVFCIAYGIILLTLSTL